MELEKKVSLEASAGSGKTFALSIRYVSLLFLGAEPQSILTLTFTNKAASEMAERITGLLKNLENKPIELSQISRLTSILENELLEQREKIYKKYIKSQINIATIDKFNNQIFKMFCLQTNILPDYEIGKVSSEEEFIKEFIEKSIKNNIYEDLVKFSAFEDKNIYSIFNFLKVLNNKREDFKKIKIPDKDKNIDNIQNEVFKEFFRLKELLLSCEILSQTGINAFEKVEKVEDILKKTWFIKDSLQEYRYFKKCWSPRVDEIFFELKNRIKEFILAKEVMIKKRYLSIFQTFVEVKKKLNKKNKVLDFDDITNYTYEMIENKTIENDILFFRFGTTIEHILIDEFQDTSILQYKILEPLIELIVENIKKQKFQTFFYVGDTKQSIYRFRGGVKELFYFVQKRFDVKKEILEKNYRSYKRVVDFVNKVFLHKISGYIPQIPNAKEEKGYIKVVESDELLEQIVNEVFFLLDSGVDENDIAILTYANGDSYIIKDEIQKRRNVKVTTATTIKLIDIQSVRAIIEFLNYLYFRDELYKANFLSLLYHDIEFEINIEKFDKHKDLVELIKDIVIYFGMFYHDENIIKLLEVASTFKDIEEFLFNWQDIDVDSPKQKDIGIRILTIHKSKGLEYEHVIIADRFKVKPSNKDSMIFHYDEIELKDMYIKFPNREYLDEDYKEAIESNKKLELDDELNTLYVALTRAVKSLIICQKSEKSSLKVLGLSNLEIGEVDLIKKQLKKEEYSKLEYHPISLQTTVLEESKKEDESLEATFGIALHQMLESMKSFDLNSLDKAFEICKLTYLEILDEDKLISIKQRVLNLLNNKEFLSLTDGKLYKELPLSYDGEIKQVDLLVQKQDHYVVIDYKTSPKIQTKHINQVSLYKKALQKILQKDVKAYLCYIRDDEVELVEV